MRLEFRRRIAAPVVIALVAVGLPVASATPGAAIGLKVGTAAVAAVSAPVIAIGVIAMVIGVSMLRDECS